jgi:xanthine dehydrogenase accessory factor
LPAQFQPVAREVLGSQSNPYQGSGLRITELKNQESPLYELAFAEFINPLPRLVIAGAGHLGRALSHLGKLLDFEVTVIDDRPEYANIRNLPDADHIVAEDIGRSMAAVDTDTDTYCVIVTRGHNHDCEALRPLIGAGAAYVGMIGSHHKVAVMKKRFLNEGWATREQWDQIHAPVGIPIGSQTVQEIAVSIAAQLVEIRNKKSGKNGK